MVSDSDYVSECDKCIVGLINCIKQLMKQLIYFLVARFLIVRFTRRFTVLTGFTYRNDSDFEL
jgi:hypothetical protein